MLVPNGSSGVDATSSLGMCHIAGGGTSGPRWRWRGRRACYPSASYYDAGLGCFDVMLQRGESRHRRYVLIRQTSASQTQVPIRGAKYTNKAMAIANRNPRVGRRFSQAMALRPFPCPQRTVSHSLQGVSIVREGFEGVT